MLVAAPKTTELYWSGVSCPQGQIIVTATERGVCWTGTPGTPIDTGLAWLKRKMEFDQVIEGEEIAPLQQAMDELRCYLAGEHIQFSCPTRFPGGFQFNANHLSRQLPGIYTVGPNFLTSSVRP